MQSVKIQISEREIEGLLWTLDLADNYVEQNLDHPDHYENQEHVMWCRALYQRISNARWEQRYD